MKAGGILALRSRRQEDCHKFEARLGYKVEGGGVERLHFSFPQCWEGKLGVGVGVRLSTLRERRIPDTGWEVEGQGLAPSLSSQAF